MSLRRSARARVSASDTDGPPSTTAAATAPSSSEKRKRKRSTMTPETSQSPGKAGSPANDIQEWTAPSGSAVSPTPGRSSGRKIVVRNPSRGTSKTQGEVREAAPEEDNGATIFMDLKADESEEAEEALQELYMSETDKKKLQTVLKAYAPELLTKKMEQGGSRKQGRTFQTLQQALSQSQCSIRSIRNHILALRQPLLSATALRPHLASSYISPPKEEVEKDRKMISLMTMALAVVDEIAVRTRGAAGEVDLVDDISKGKREEDDYALHMRLPSGDYFTNAIRLPKQEALEMDTGYSKLVSIATQPIALDSRPPPTLKDRLHPVRTRRIVPAIEAPEEDISKPVSHLYYGPWSSFAPTYDSFDGNLSMQASCALWRAKREDRKVLERMMKEPPPSQRQELQETLESLKDVDTQAILSEYDNLKEPPSLEANARLLEKLDQLQEQRWKRTFAKRLLKSNFSDFDEPSREERDVAGEILDILTQLLSNHSGMLSDLIPAPEILHAASTSACIDPALMDQKGEPGYWGSLNESLYGPEAKRRITGARSIPVRLPGAIRDNETIKMESVNEEKVSATVAQAGATVRGKGLLDRFALGRQYTLQDHPHDRKLVVPGSQQPPIPGQPSNRPPPPGGPNNMMPYRTAMSPPSASTPPAARPYHHPQMRPAAGTPTSSYLQQSPQSSSPNKIPYYRPGPPASQSPRGGAWPQPLPVSQQQQQTPTNHAFYPAGVPFSAGRPPIPQEQHRFVSGSPS